MYWLIDVFVILLILFAAIVGIKKGFFATSGEILGVILSLAIAVGLAFLIVWFPMRQIGAVETLRDSLYKWLGGDSQLFHRAGVDFEQICEYIAMGVWGLVFLIPCYILSNFLVKKLRQLLVFLRTYTVYRCVDSIIGLVVDVALAGALVVGIMAVVCLLPSVFPIMDESFKAAALSRHIYGLVCSML